MYVHGVLFVCLYWVYFKFYKVEIIKVEIIQDLFSLEIALLKRIHITSFI